MNENNRLVLCIYNDQGVPLCFKDLKDSFPKDIGFVKIGVKWEEHYHSWYEGFYRLNNFYSTILDKTLSYPQTYKELFENLEMIFAEHIQMGTIGIDDDTGDFCPLIYKGETSIFSILRDVMNSIETTIDFLPIAKLKGEV